MTEIDSTDVRLRALMREARPAPPLPPRFAEAVWRRIDRVERGSRPPARGAGLEAWIAAVLRPRFAVPGVAALVVLSAFAGLRSGGGSARQEAQARYVAAVAPFTLH